MWFSILSSLWAAVIREAELKLDRGRIVLRQPVAWKTRGQGANPPQTRHTTLGEGFSLASNSVPPLLSPLETDLIKNDRVQQRKRLLLPPVLCNQSVENITPQCSRFKGLHSPRDLTALFKQ